ncbi:MAG: TIM barrel protein [Isosphaeraceae bacterium]|nr:TIM barrel protein [Isosphaeraceae bacterium]
MSSLDRRTFLGSGLAALAARGASARVWTPADEPELPAPKYRLAMNLELMFPRAMPYEKRLEAAADAGADAYGFWSHVGRNIDALLEVQQKRKLTCASITGAPRTGNSSGLTETGKEQAFLDDLAAACAVARKLGAKNLITFVGRKRTDTPWEKQKEQIIAGLRKAAKIAEEFDVYVTLEPLNRIESPQMTMTLVGEAYEYASAVDHPRIKVDFDIYHRALGEGNIINTLEDGLKRGLVRFVEVGDVPGRKEPGSGETNYANIFRVLRKRGFDGFVGMEHGTTRDPAFAWNRVKQLAGL